MFQFTIINDLKRFLGLSRQNSAPWSINTNELEVNRLWERVFRELVSSLPNLLKTCTGQGLGAIKLKTHYFIWVEKLASFRAPDVANDVSVFSPPVQV